MELEYYAILTEIGTAAIANATVLGQKIALTQFAVGDGGGSYYRPTKEMTALKGEKWRGEINSYEIDSSNPDLINVKAVIPALIGGFTIREMGLFDKDGRLIAISNTPDSVKITTDSGAVKEMEMVMELLVSNANIVSIQVNPTVSIATKEDIQKHNQSLNAHKEQFNEKVNTNLNNVARETLLQKMGNVTENLENIVGTTENTGGTTSAGTVMAKLNKLLTDWTSTRADKIDTINNTIGTTANTGGTASAGTVMAKLNKLLTDWTNVRAGKIDTINTNAAKLTDTRVGYIDKLANFGTITDTGGTATAGTIMAKLNKLLTDWTTARAGKIDTINTNAANLNTRLTSTRAGYLDLLNRGVSIKNIQRGFFFVNIKNGVPVENEYRITLSTIVPSKTFILTSGKMFSASGTISEDRIDTIGTTYFIYLPGLAGTSSGSYGVRWQAIEFY